jgi:SagB-type dehydrogenase family enzyme
MPLLTATPPRPQFMTGSRELALLAAGTSIALATGFCGCDRHRAQAPEKIRELNELPIAQLRVLLKGFPGEWQPDSDRSHAQPEPPAEKPTPAGAKRIALTPLADIRLGDMPVREAISARRSVRDFSDAPLSLEELSFLLWATQGVTAVQRDDAGAIIQRFRAAPSGGARYPLETYLTIHRVSGLAPGLYRYLPNDHQLILVREDAQISNKLMAACYAAPAVGEAAVVFIWSAVPYRTEWKYAYLAHRMIAMEAGHVCENLYLAAQSCGSGACAMLSYHQPRVDELLGVDGDDEFAIYVTCVGKPKTE